VKKIWRFMREENLHRVLAWVVALVVLSSILISLLEPGLKWVDSVWWSIVTLTTVGYGDFSPVTGGGRAVAVIIMFLGIGLLGTLSATLASMMISRRLKEDKGMSKYNFEKHIIICEWNHRALAILKEIRSDAKTCETPVVLIAECDSTPVDDPDLYFVKGPVNDETLARASAAAAETVVILGDDKLDANARDAKVVLSTLTVECHCEGVYTVVELVEEKNRQHCVRAQADEIIVGNELSSHLIASAALNHGISRIVSELLSTQYGNDLYEIPAPATLAGKQFIDVFTRLKKEHQVTVLGVQKGKAGNLVSNPPGDYVVDSGDYLIVMGTSAAMAMP
jgi:voltage-gated potassium channel